jgi:hypothetical protein
VKRLEESALRLPLLQKPMADALELAKGRGWLMTEDEKIWQGAGGRKGEGRPSAAVA